jgi:hypothetical protein
MGTSESNKSPSSAQSAEVAIGAKKKIGFRMRRPQARQIFGRVGQKEYINILQFYVMTSWQLV